MKITLSNMNDSSLDKWIYKSESNCLQSAPAAASKRNGFSHDEIIDILDKFHIGSDIQLETGSHRDYKNLLPPNLQTPLSSEWLSSPTSKRFKSENYVAPKEDLSKWLAKESTSNTSNDFDKWLIQTAPSASKCSSLPGIRIELNIPPLSAFLPPTSEIPPKHEDQLMDSEEEEEEDDFLEVSMEENPLSQWLLVNSTSKSGSMLTSTKLSIEEWLDGSSCEREPSIVVLSETDSTASSFDQFF